MPTANSLPTKLQGTPTLDRLRYGAYRLVLDGKGHRKPRPLNKTQKNAVETNPK